jgi:hypothetical protein
MDTVLRMVGDQPLSKNHDETVRQVNDVHENPCVAALASSLDDETCLRVLYLFAIYMDELRYNSGQLASFWLIFSLVNVTRSRGWLVTPLRQQTENVVLQLTKPTTLDISQCSSCRWHCYRVLHRNSTIIF